MRLMSYESEFGKSTSLSQGGKPLRGDKSFGAASHMYPLISIACSY